MARRRLGCFTGPAIVAVVLTMLAITAAARVGGGGLFSPGALSAQTGPNAPLGNVHSHAELGGQCAACHPAPWAGATMADSCLACHKNIQEQLSQPSSFHTVLMKEGAAQGQAGCQPCHPEHRGAQATLTVVKQNAFPHDATGYSLAGHQESAPGVPFNCADCHTNDVLHFDQTICTTCHAGSNAGFMARHQAAYGENCLACHDGKDTYGKAFDHNKVAFKLDGKHAALDCGQCHTGARTPADLKATPQKCVDCHAKDDLHRGQLGTECRQCHSSAGWKPAVMDHSQTGFPLEGEHTTVACSDCHANNVYKGTPQNCAGCHLKDDIHKGKLGADCQNCHTVDGWKPANFDHSKSAFPLTGKHATVACADCHADKGFAGTPQNCVVCHLKDDVHKGKVGADCATCHTTDDWTKTTFDHAKSGYPLVGKHQTVACSACHTDKTFAGAPQNCAGCHLKDDPHAGRLGSDCGACHTPMDWNQATIDHSLTGWPLVGKHATVACADCHQNGVWHGVARDCYSCHQKDDTHNGKFGTLCSQCHTPIDWKQATFDHGRSGFPLTGAHANVACLSCHTNGFANTPTQCVACHQKDDAHGGKFGTDCGSCHRTNAWKPATFDHARSGFPLTGAHTGLNCQACHANGFAGTPKQCVACHQKNDAHGGKFGSDCGACHSTNAWKPANFDHNRSGFPLTGAHSGVSCQNCHANGFAGTPKQCVACHQKNDAHGGKFGSDCGACHSTNAWKPANFDHNRSGFPLTGAHGSLPCQSCHANGFAGTPAVCEGCHHEPAYHAGLFPTGCSRCHTTSSWTPASYNGSHTFPMGHGGAGNDCHKCHPSTLAQWTCSSCHSNASMDSRHSGVQGYSHNCIACHSGGGGGGD